MRSALSGVGAGRPSAGGGSGITGVLRMSSRNWIGSFFAAIASSSMNDCMT